MTKDYEINALLAKPARKAPRVGLGLSNRLSIMCAAMCLSLGLAISLFSFFVHRNASINYHGQKAAAVASAVASMIDSARFTESVLSDYPDDYWHYVKRIINATIAKIESLTFLYIMLPAGEGQFSYWLSVTSRREEGVAFFKGQEHSVFYDSEAFTAVREGRVTSTGITAAREWGALIKGFAPVKDARGNVIALVGADFDITGVMASVNIFGLTVLTAAVVFILIFGLLSYWYCHRVIEKPLESLAKHAKEVANGNADADFIAQSNNNIGWLSDSFLDIVNSMNILKEKERVSFSQRLNGSLANIIKSPEFSSGSIEEAAWVINREGALALEASRAGVWLLEDCGMVLKTLNYYCKNSDDKAVRKIFYLSDVPEYASSIKYERLTVIHDVKKPNVLQNVMDDYDKSVCALIEANIRIGSEFVGVVCIEQDYCKDYPRMREWTIEEQNFAASLADFMASTLAAAKQRTLEKQHQDILNNLPGMAYQSQLRNSHYVFTFVSKGCEELSGYTAKEMVGKSELDFFDIVHPDDREALLRLNRKTLHLGLPLDTVFRITTKGGQEKWIWEKSAVLKKDSGGTAQLFEGFFFDITKQRRAEEAELENRAKSDFLAKMSHEIRTPMNAILGMAKIILQENHPPDVHEQAVTIKHSGEHLLSIINDILDFSKIESGKLEIINAPYLLHDVIRDVVSIIKIRATNPAVRFAVYMQHDLPNNFSGDAVRLRQVLLNVLSNAAKYTNEGYFALEITGGKTADDLYELVMKIKDTGIGIKAQDAKNLFTDFAQFDIEKNKGIEGTGLGLAITHNLVKLMGGSIEAHSEYGEGSEFVITLSQKCFAGQAASRFDDISALVYCRSPLVLEYTMRCLDDLGVKYGLAIDEKDFSAKVKDRWDYIFAEADLVYSVPRDTGAKAVMLSDSYDGSYAARDGQDFSILVMPVYLLPIINALTTNTCAGGLAAKSACCERHGNFTTVGANILLVDDIKTNLKVGAGLLKPYGASVTLCLSGKEAIDAVRFGDYDLVFMDHMMPHMDGLEAVKNIRSLDGEKYAKLPIIALTANAIVGAKEMFLQNGFDDFLSKPIETAQLNEILAKWIPEEKRQYAAAQVAAGAETQDPANIYIEGVDTQRGLSLSGGNAAQYVDILATFRKEGVKKIGELAACLGTGYLETKNLELYTTHVHALKSACANIGARDLSKEAAALEDAGVKQNADFIAKNHRFFSARFEKLLDNINAFVAVGGAADDENFDGEPLGSDILKNKLSLLKTALAEFDTDSIDEICEGLQKNARRAQLADAVEEILDSVFISRYKQAQEQIDTLLASDSFQN